MRKNILCTIDTRGPGGAETIFLTLVERLDRNKYNRHLILSGKGWVYDQAVKMGIYPEIIESEGSFNVSYLTKLIKYIKGNHIDLVHSHLLGANVYCSIAGLLCRVPVISTFHGTVDSGIRGNMPKLKFHLINAGSKYIVFVSNYLKNYYLSWTAVNKTKSMVIYNGICYNRFATPKNGRLREELGYSNDDVLIGSIGNFRHSKGYDVLLKAASIVVKSFPQAKFISVGEGHGQLYKKMSRLKQRLGLENNVTFLGFRSDVENILSSLDLFVLPSRTEGFSLSTIEAMAAGVPVIVTNSGGPGEIVTHLQDGIIVDAKSPKSMAQGVKMCLSDAELRSALSSNARRTIQSRFTEDSMVMEYVSLYDACST